MRPLVLLLHVLCCLLRPHPSLGVLVDPNKLPLSTDEQWIVDSSGDRVKWSCVNWYGPNLYDTNVVGGLEHQPLDVLTANIKDLGFNCIRLPFTVEQALDDPAVPLHSALPKTPLAANPQLLGLSSMEVFDATVQSLTDAGLMIILNVHTSASVWCCQLSSYEGWWETPEWTLSQFEQSLVELTQRYKSNPLVVAMDLRNEIHDVNPPDGTNTPIGWDRGDPSLDWYKVAKRTGDLVLAENPDMLIVVTALCFGMDLRGCKSTGAVELSVPNKLVWTVHSYRFFTPFYDIPQMLDVKDYSKLAGLSVTAFLVSSTLLAFLVKSSAVNVTRRVLVCSAVGTWFLLMTIGTAAAFVAAATLKTTCNTWYHEDAKYAPGAFLGVTFGVPVLAAAVYFGATRLSAKQEREEDSIAMVDVSRPVTESNSTMIEPPPRTPDSLPVASLKAALLTAVSTFGIISLVSTVWSLVATTPAVYANFNDRMWGFAATPDKSYTAPVWMSEFGADTRDAYWVSLITYLADTDMDWAVWAFYGATRYEKVEGEGGRLVNMTYPETYGLMNEDYSDTQFAGNDGGDWRIQDMQAVMPQNPDISGLELKATDGVW